LAACRALTIAVERWADTTGVGLPPVRQRIEPPSSQSPFAEEYELLQVAQDRWFDRAHSGTQQLWRDRIQWLRFDQTMGAPAPPSPFWSPTALALRRTSYYGNLNERQTIAAIGSALFEVLDKASRRVHRNGIASICRMPSVRTSTAFCIARFCAGRRRNECGGADRTLAEV